MAKYVTPRQFRSEDNHLLNAFGRIAEERGLSRNDAETAFRLLPREMRNAPCFKNRLHGKWEYEYGEPYDVGDQVISGSNVAHRVDYLFDGINAAHSLLSSGDYLRLISDLSLRQKHQDHLAELDPLIRAVKLVAARYEPDDVAASGKRVDWLLEFEDRTSCLLEVKNRIRAIIEMCEAVGKHREEPKHAPVPVGIFKDVETKLPPAIPGRWQGVWLWSVVFYEPVGLKREFERTDRGLVQFAVVTHADTPVRILARDSSGGLKTV